MFQVITFYRFVPIQDLEYTRSCLQALCMRFNLRGTLLVAPEGVNATLSGQELDISAWLHEAAESLDYFKELPYQSHVAQGHPFRRLKVRIKKELVPLGLPQVSPIYQPVGIHVDPAGWDELLAAPLMRVVDVRNQCETDQGAFAGAIAPQTTCFREFTRFVTEHLSQDKETPIAMYCTGGIRCEKASAYLLNQGFQTVYQLQGGIIHYLRAQTQGQAGSAWQGQCFVFDERGSI